ncbi:MAG: sulfurtransferase [Anaerolineales bacterium]|nr:sulfurtransferase [Anaerolineales bacterium]
MKYKTFLSVSECIDSLNTPDWVFLDCRFSLQEPDQGFQEYLEGHIPGAIYVHLNRDLSGKIVKGKTGRHPLPEIDIFVDRVSSWGIDRQTQVIAYDNSGGALAARVWWMLRWFGHEQVAVLDGGWDAWVKSGNIQEKKQSPRTRKEFLPNLQPNFIVNADFVEKIRNDPDFLLIDARAPQRYWAIEETTDSLAGHIPGAISAPYLENLDDDGFFLDDEILKNRFEKVLGGYSPENIVVYCGSGVTAAHNMIAMHRVGYELPKIYAGSWSDWITDPNRPTAP